MSLIARRLISNRNLIKCSIISVMFLSNKQTVLSKLPSNNPNYSFNVLKLKYSTETSNVELKAKFDKLVKDKKIVVFMKGIPDRPQCGFSKAVVDILRFHGASFESHNVLADESIRSGIKEYTDWPTIPQIFFNGEFVGGCDILLEMHKSGDLVEELEKIGIISKLAEEKK